MTITNKDLANYAILKGYENIATVVKTHFASTYWNLNRSTSVAKEGKFRGAPVYNGYRHGIITSELPESCIARTLLRYMYLKETK
jgi:hypothetical protein